MFNRVPLSLSLHNYGPNILTGVQVTVMDDEDVELGRAFKLPYIAGTIGAYGFTTLPDKLTPMIDPRTGMASYEIIIAAQSGEVDELLQFRPGKAPESGFAFRLLVSKHNAFDKNGKRIYGSKSQTELADYGWSDEPSQKEP